MAEKKHRVGEDLKSMGNTQNNLSLARGSLTFAKKAVGAVGESADKLKATASRLPYDELRRLFRGLGILHDSSSKTEVGQLAKNSGISDFDLRYARYVVGEELIRRKKEEQGG